MVRVIALVVVFASCVFSVHGQGVKKPVKFVEPFADNSRGWSLFNQGASKTSIQDGALRFTGTRGMILKALVPHLMDQNKDYEISMRFRAFSMSVDGTIGIQWGGDKTSATYLSMGHIGTMTLAEVGEGEKKPTSSLPRASLFFKPWGTWQTLRIVCKGYTCSVYLNDSLALQSQKPMRSSGYLGIYTMNEVSCEIDELIVNQDNSFIEDANVVIGAKKESLGPNVNSAFEEEVPLISPDGKTVYFATKGDPSARGGREDWEIKYAAQSSDGSWQKRQDIGPPLNNNGPNWIISITPDNQSALIANQYRNDGGPGGGGISRSEWLGSSWSLPRTVRIDNFNNRSDFYQFYLAQDQQTLLIAASLTIDSPNSNDIYVAFAKPDGSFGTPINLGPTINTVLDEYTPFLASDGVTLYFSTQGRPGYGREDVYMSRRLDSTWTNWTEPINLGPEINSVGADKGFSIPASGTYAYMTSTSQETGTSDIVRIKLAESIKPYAVVLVSGRVLNSKTKAPVGAEIRYLDLKTNKLLGKASSNPLDGSYKIVLPGRKRYAFLAQRDGFYATSQNINLDNLALYSEVNQDLLLNPIEAGTKVVLNNLFFDTGSSDIRSESFAELDRLVQLMEKEQSLKVRIDGHTDDVGTDNSNQALSEKRALTVVEYVRSKGIEENRLTWKGWGKRKPLSKKGDAEGRQQNRRVEFTIVSK